MLGSLCMSVAFATPEDRELPLDITADWSEFNNTTSTGIYRGNVVMNQGNLTIHADEATFQLVEGELDYIIATGAPVKIEDLPQLNDPWVYGEGLKLSYYPKKEVLILETEAQVEQKQDIVNANKIIYNLTTRTVNAERGDNERVHFTIKMDSQNK